MLKIYVKGINMSTANILEMVIDQATINIVINQKVMHQFLIGIFTLVAVARLQWYPLHKLIN